MEWLLVLKIVELLSIIGKENDLGIKDTLEMCNKNKIVLIKNGSYYKISGNDALVMWYLFNYKYKNNTIEFVKDNFEINYREESKMEYYQELLKIYIKNYKENTPILIEEIKRFFKGLSRTSEEYEATMRKVYVSINRLVRKGYLNSFSDGIYYKGVITKEDVIKKKYIENESGVIGYYVGDIIVSNKCNKRSYYNKTLGVWVEKPRVEITNDNYKYLELLDKIKYGCVSCEDVRELVRENNLDYIEIIKYAKESGDKMIERLCNLN